MDNTETQKEEIVVLQSIYEEKIFVVECMNPPCGRFSAHVQLSDPFCVRLNNIPINKESDSSSSDSDYEEFQLNYLPPVNLHFEYPESYPSSSPPAFLLSCCWLTYDQLSKLCKHLDVLWSESNGEVILFQWVQFLKEETLNFLHIEKCLDITELSKYNLKVDFLNTLLVGIQLNENSVISKNDTQTSQEKNNLDADSDAVRRYTIPSVKPSISGGSGSRDNRAFLDIADGKILKHMLKDYNESKKLEHFHESWHLCDICFANKKGSECIIFQVCHHFYCKDCIKSYFEIMINEGNVHSLNCPYDKCSTQADGTLVKQIVSKDNFERYDSLLLSMTLGTMSDIAYCPRKACQCPLLIDVDERIGTCPACRFVFCPFCKMAYHGVAPCKFDPSLREQICKEYLTGNSSKKAEIENRHGKRIIKSLVEEVLSERWIGSNSKHCPHCNAAIEKNDGCNKMTCFKCGTYFCWLCEKQLSSANPYFHYSDQSSRCYNNLYPPDMNDYNLMGGLVFEAGEFLGF